MFCFVFKIFVHFFRHEAVEHFINYSRVYALENQKNWCGLLYCNICFILVAWSRICSVSTVCLYRSSQVKIRVFHTKIFCFHPPHLNGVTILSQKMLDRKAVMMSRRKIVRFWEDSGRWVGNGLCIENTIPKLEECIKIWKCSQFFLSLSEFIYSDIFVAHAV